MAEPDSPAVSRSVRPHVPRHLGPELTPESLAGSIWYDRAGYGWSEPGPPPRTVVAVANDLHKLVSTARVQPPYVMMGMGDMWRHWFASTTASIGVMWPALFSDAGAQMRGSHSSSTRGSPCK